MPRKKNRAQRITKLDAISQVEGSESFVLTNGTAGYRCVGVFGSVEAAHAAEAADPPELILLDVGLSACRDQWNTVAEGALSIECGSGAHFL